MARKTEQTTIDGMTYEVTQMGAVKGRRVTLLLFRAIGPAMGEVVSANLLENGAKLFLGFQAGKDEAKAAVTDDLLATVGAALAKGFATLASSMRDEDLDALCEAFEETTQLVYKSTGGAAVRAPLKGQFDDHFAGRMVPMVQWLAFCVRVNFGNFFDYWKKDGKPRTSDGPQQEGATVG